MITTAQRRKLRELGYDEAVLRTMKPQTAHQILDEAAAKERRIDETAVQLLEQALGDSQTASVSYLVWRDYADQAGIGESALAGAIKRLRNNKAIDQRDGDGTVVAYG